MDLTQKSAENIEYMVNAIKEKLKMANVAVIKPEDFNEDTYEDLLDVYEMIKRKDNFSISEMQAIAEELGNLRNAN